MVDDEWVAAAEKTDQAVTIYKFDAEAKTAEVAVV